MLIFIEDEKYGRWYYQQSYKIEDEEDINWGREEGSSRSKRDK